MERRTAWALMVAIAAWMLVAPVRAHEVTHRGTVVAIEAARVQVQTLTDDGAKGELTWFDITDRTTVTRGDQTVTFADAAIAKGERIVVEVDHDRAPTVALRVRLAARR